MAGQEAPPSLCPFQVGHRHQAGLSQWRRWRWQWPVPFQASLQGEPHFLTWDEAPRARGLLIGKCLTYSGCDASQVKRDRCARVCLYRLEAFAAGNPPWQSCPAHGLGGLCLGGHVSLAERNGQLQVLLFLPPQPRQPLLLRLLTFPLGPRQLLLLIAKLQRENTS